MITPRPYQDRCYNAVLDAWDQHQSVLVDMATGLGKTCMFCLLTQAIVRQGGRAIIMAHTDELIRQAADSITRITGQEPGIEKADERTVTPMYGLPPVTVTSVQTMSRPNRLEKFSPSEFRLLVVDEAHHARGSTYRRVIEHFTANSQLRVLGVTATPRRNDGLALGDVFQHCAFQYEIQDAIPDGWLVPIRQHQITVDDLDFSQVRSTAGDLNELDLEGVLIQEKPLHAVAAPLHELAGDRPTLVFCVTVNHAKKLAEVLDRYKRGCAAFICGNKTIHPWEKRREMVAAYKAGNLQYLCSVGIFVEGFDAPNTQVVAWARPTKSLPFYMQGLGRGTRALTGTLDGLETAEPAARRQAIADSAKPHLDVIDFVGNSGRHKIVTCMDALGGRYGEVVRHLANRAAKEAKPGGVNVEEALERAYRWSLLEEQESRRLQHVRAVAEFRQRQVDIMDAACQVPAVGVGISKHPATPGQVRYLIHLGLDRERAEKMTKKQAGLVISKLKAQRERQQVA